MMSNHYEPYDIVQGDTLAHGTYEPAAESRRAWREQMTKDGGNGRAPATA